MSSHSTPRDPTPPVSSRTRSKVKMGVPGDQKSTSGSYRSASRLSTASKAASIKRAEIDSERDDAILELSQQQAEARENLRISASRLRLAKQKHAYLLEKKKTQQISDSEKLELDQLPMEIFSKEENHDTCQAKVERLESTAEAWKVSILSRHARELQINVVDELSSDEENASSASARVLDWIETQPVVEHQSKMDGQPSSKSFLAEECQQVKSLPSAAQQSQTQSSSTNSQSFVPEHNGSQHVRQNSRRSTATGSIGSSFFKEPPSHRPTLQQSLSNQNNPKRTQRKQNTPTYAPLHPPSRFQSTHLSLSNYQTSRFPSSGNNFANQSRRRPTQPLPSPRPQTAPRFTRQEQPKQFPYHPMETPDMMRTTAIQELTTALKSAIGNGHKPLPVFDGNPSQWMIFLGAYERSYFNYDESENLARLIECLKGEAKATIEHLLTNPANVNEVIGTLKHRFGRPEMVLDYIVEKVKMFKGVETGKPEVLVKFGTLVETLVTNIRSFNKPGYMYNTCLIQELVRKLPHGMQSGWYKTVARNMNQDMTLVHFNNWLKPEVDAAMLQIRHRPEEYRRQRNPGVHAAVLEKDEKEKAGCAHCENKLHGITDCKIFKALSVDDRWERVKLLKLCYKCLDGTHLSPDCPTQPEQGSKYNSLLKRDKKDSKPSKPKAVHTAAEGGFDSDSEEEQSTAESQPISTTLSAITTGTLPVVPINVCGPKGSVKVFALLDSGANVSLLEDSVAEQLGFEGKSAPFRFVGFQNEVNEFKNSKMIDVTVKGRFRGASEQEIDKVRTVTKLNIAGVNLNVELLKEKYPHLRHMKAKTLRNAVPQMLIGFRHFRLFAPRVILEDECASNAPSAYNSLLGWYVSDGSESHQSYFIRENVDQDMNHMIQQYFSTEAFGVKISEDSQKSAEDKRSLELLEKHSRKTGEQWESCLLWKQDNPRLPESKEMAMKRLFGMQKKMSRDPDFKKLCEDKFSDYVKKGYLKPVNKENLGSSLRWYLPWFFAYHPTKKPRLVFDAAAVSRGKSLNDFLHKGPDLLRPLPAVLMRFRRHTVGLSADISEMFHRVSLREGDRPAQTILYSTSESEPVEYEMQVLFFGSASSPASALYCKSMNARNYLDKYPSAVRATESDFYMDDYLGGAETPEYAVKLQKQLLLIHAKGGFPLLKWNSNSSDVLKKIPAEIRSVEKLSFSDLEQPHYEKTLGLYWDPASDQFGFKLNFQRIPAEVATGEMIPTKRMMCSLLMSIFDPLGFVAHFKVKGLILLQHVWRCGVGWDDQIPHSIFEPWQKFLVNLKKIGELHIPRRLSPHSLYIEDSNVQLHIFCDASEECFAAAAYLRHETRGSVTISLVFGKARVAPLKGLSIPRMELQAGVMGSRMAKTIQDSYDIDLQFCSVTMWTDSKTLLSWIRSPTIRRNQFVGNRVSEILELTNVQNWKWVPTADNVADDATRLKSTADLTCSSRWLNGPSFLREDESFWPVENFEDTENQADRSEDKGMVFSISSIESQVINCSKKSILPDVERISKWITLLRATSRVFLVARMCHSPKGRHEICVEDMERAKKMWIKQVQVEQFSKELEDLNNGLVIDKKSSLFRLSPILNDDGIIVMKSRLANADISSGMKYPPILGSKHRYVDLMIRHVHEKGGHFGQERTVNELRKSCWIISCREAVRRVVQGCLICRMKAAKASTTEMGALPVARVDPMKPPYFHCAVDYFGPYSVRIQRSTVKRWGVLFTCLTTRAVHLELAENLETSSFLNVLSRFVNLRGQPRHMTSDNGTNFAGADKIISSGLKNIDWKAISDDGVNKGMQWHFIPPASPHHGGSWEKLVGLTKKILGNLLKEQHPSEDTLRTLFAEVTGILNSRPLTTISPDPMDLACLTPNDLLNVSCVPGSTIPGDYDESDLLRRSYRYAQKLTVDFWRRWSAEYLPWLAKRSKWFTSGKQLQVGDLVLLLEDNAPRNAWKKGIILKVFPGKDGQIRSVEVKITIVDPVDKKKEVKTSILHRPVVKICPLG